MGTESSRKRRRYGLELKAQTLIECDAPGASVAKVAMVHGINANIVHGRRKLALKAADESVAGRFVPIAVAPTVSRTTDEGSIVVRAMKSSLS